MSRSSNYLLVIGEAEALRWILAEQRMAFAPGRVRQATSLQVGDRLLLYTSRGCFHNPTRDRSRVIGEATVTSPVAPLEDPIEIAGREFTAGCSLRIDSLAPWREGVEIAPLVPQLALFPAGTFWPIRLRQTLVAIPAGDAAMLRAHLEGVALPGLDAESTYHQ